MFIVVKFLNCYFVDSEHYNVMYGERIVFRGSHEACTDFVNSRNKK